MKRILVVALLVVGVLVVGLAGARADSYTRGSSDHPLRYLAYAAHPFGIAVEYGVLRPIHWVVSRKGCDVIFGHEPNIDDRYFVWH